ncbi:MAG: 50S ribosomal protein L9 [Candidatus Niyogibacteria bacterium RIFCSPLOWO2_12_FULL_41_13]|uniref:Large ribosomal subunit protein bL9 n=1 Tax=Candidatus Niyogibacteria bacterium RIFCSPLOWO2_12_FULL_41_13 TaxID=1801726 RepID=A0A1G2F3C3_9BACT|nr:MAG: 50S ribosomal protein L9 [Candidatus Niyogibacteria bacterium RIFCSPLOWO2_12_FULL_41_13]
MKIILLDNVINVGKRNDIKDVSDGYARNFLLTRNLAVLATLANLKNLEQKKKREETEKEKKKREIESIFEKIKDKIIAIKEKANEKGELFGSVGKEEIMEALKKEGIEEIKEEYIKLDKPIKSAGEHKIALEFDELKTIFVLKVHND